MNPFNLRPIVEQPKEFDINTNTKNFFDWLIKEHKDTEITINDIAVIITVPIKDDILCLTGTIIPDKNTFNVNLYWNDDSLSTTIIGLHQILNMEYLAQLTLEHWRKELNKKMVYTYTNSR